MGVDEKKQTYNINADTAAGALAISVKSRRLLLMTDVEGVCDKSNKLFPEISSVEAEKLIFDETIHGGMIPKIRTCINAVNNDKKPVSRFILTTKILVPIITVIIPKTRAL